MKSFAWQTVEYVHQEKTSDWYWTVGIITVALIAVSIIFGNALFGIVLALGVFALTMLASRRPDDITVNIYEKGVAINKTLYPFSSLQSFHLDEDHHHGPRLLFKSKKAVMPLLAVPVDTEDMEELRAFLVAHLKEESFDQGVMHALLERMGF